MKVLFLDIDGVLNSVDWFKRRSKLTAEEEVIISKEDYLVRRHIDPEAVHRMNLVAEKTGCKFVLSSTWRLLSGVDMTSKVLKRAGATFELLDMTPECARMDTFSNGLFDEGERGAEIYEWLQAHPGVESFVIVDDASDMGALRDRLVRTNNEVGLQYSDVQKILAMLS